MSITITISDQLELAGAGAAAVAYNASLPDLPDGSRPPTISTQEYLQQRVEQMCDSYRNQYAVDRIPSSAFVMRFPVDAYAQIRAAAPSDPVLAGFVQAVDEAPYVWLGAQQVIDGVNYCVPAFITQVEADAILYYQVPSP